MDAEMEIRAMVADMMEDELVHLASDGGMVGATARETLREYGYEIATEVVGGMRKTTVKAPVEA